MTIDHLRPDYGVRVLRDFTDARGRSCRAGESAIIRQMGLDWERQEIWMDWEQNGSATRLYFALRAAAGPGNGRMREYFELGEPDPALARPLPPVVTPPTPARPRGTRYAGKHPPADFQLGEVMVACDCDPALHRAVLVESRGVNACLRCGTVTCSRSIGDDGRHTGNAWQVYLAVAVPGHVLDWLARWPRVTVRGHPSEAWPGPNSAGRQDTIYLPADSRCETEAELLALEDKFLGRRDETIFPTEEPPADLPQSLGAFAEFWTALQLTPESDLAHLMTSAQSHLAGSAFAVQRLLRRADACDVMVRGLRSRDDVWFRSGIAMAMTARPVDPRLAGVLVEVMSGLNLDTPPDLPDRVVSRPRIQSLLAVIAHGKIDSPEMLVALKALQRRLVRRDDELVSSLGLVLRALHGEPPPQHAGPYLP